MIMMRPWLEDLVVIIHSLYCPKISWSRLGLGTRLRLHARTPNTPSTSAPMSSLSANLIEKIVKKAQEPLKEEIKGMRIDMAALTMKITSVENGMQNVGKQSREILTSVDQKRGNISTLCSRRRE